MNRQPLILLAASSLLTFGGFLSSPAIAVPVTITFTDVPGQCDPRTGTPNHELGDPTVFGGSRFRTEDEAIREQTNTITRSPCPRRPDTAQVNVRVSITNLTPFNWTNLYFVADLFATGGALELQNFDGRCNGGLCFRIDNVGNNQPLISESIRANLIFQPGETWIFDVQDWRGTGSRLPPPDPDVLLGSVGVPSPGTTSSNASIVATLGQRVPEPSTLALLSISAFGALYVRKRTMERLSKGALELKR